LSPDWLIEDGLLRPEDCRGRSFSATSVDYGAVIAFKEGLLAAVKARFDSAPPPGVRADFERFVHDHAHWLEDYALFRALKDHFHGAGFLEWPQELSRREPAALEAARRDLAGRIDAVRLSQFLVFRQIGRLREHARARGVCLLGDLPFYASLDSCDVWAHPELFLLDERRRPLFVAGVPPDYFSDVGQLWGNPVHDWEAQRRTGYRWCIDRLKAALASVDVVRLDHFRGFAGAWHVPAGAPTAVTGTWVPGPGAELFDAVQEELHALPFIAEDLGVITPDVEALLERMNFAGSRVLQFAFEEPDTNPHLPHRYVHNTVVYTGTHDNTTTRAWFEGLVEPLRDEVWRYLERPAGEGREIAWELIELAWSSKAALAVAPLQDLLNLGVEGRMNHPGQAEGNWRWRATPEMLSDPAFERLAALTRTSGRQVLPPPT
jgi:4-alpha-glucanotransferase